MRRLWIVFALIVLGIARALLKQPQEHGLSRQIRDWEGEGGRIPGVPSNRTDR